MSVALNDAAAQLRRLLLALPALDDDLAHPLADIAARVGTDVPTLERDLRTLVTRDADEPGGFAEGVQLLLGADTVRLRTPGGHFRRPMALSREELHTLELGIAMLQQEAPPDEAHVMRRARQRLQKAMVASVPPAHEGEPHRYLSLGAESPAARTVRRELQEGIRGRQVASITYRSASRNVSDERRVQPLGVVWARGAWYLVAWCERSAGMRVFRLDRIQGVTATGENFTPPDGFSLESVMREGRVLTNDATEVVRISYGPRISRWIAEREGAERQPDGSVIVERPLLDDDWAVRHVLQYGPEAVVLAPERVRVAVVERLRQVGAG